MLPPGARDAQEQQDEAPCLDEVSKFEMTPKHLKLWYEMASRESGSYSKLKVLRILGSWAKDMIPLFVTIVLSFVDEEEDESSLRELKWTLQLHLVCSLIRFFINMSNPNKDDISRGMRLRKCLLVFLANIFMILKPFRTIYGYFYRSRHGRCVEDHLISRTPLTRREIKSVISMNKLNLIEMSYDLTEAFIQTLPMALLHLYIFFQDDQTFGLCSRADFARLFMLLCCVYSSAKAVSEYDWHYNNYLKSLHFLYYFDTGHPINLESQNRWTHFLNLLCNILLVVHRFYCISYFLSVSRTLAGIYLLTLLLTQSILLLICPWLRMEVENPIFGVRTIISEMMNRWINLFANHMTRFTRTHAKGVKIFGCYRFHFPFTLFQLITFVIPMMTVSGLSYLYGSDWEHYELLKSVKQPFETQTSLKLNDSVITIPCTNITVEPSSVVLNFVLEFVSITHRKASNRFLSFNDLFGVIYFLPASMYFYLLCSLCYSYALSWFYIADSMFPVLRAYEFWHFLITKFTTAPEGLRGIKAEKSVESRQRSVRRLMVLTIMSDAKLYKFYYFRSLRVCDCLRGCNCTRKGQGRSGRYLDDFAEDLVYRMSETGEALEEKLAEVFRLNHPLNRDFRRLVSLVNEVNEGGRRQRWEVEVDKKLFLVFYLKFENRLRGMTSDRIQTIFSSLGVPINKLEL